MMVQWPVARFWVPLNAWHVLPMSARFLSWVSCPLLLSKVQWLRDRCVGIIASAAKRSSSLYVGNVLGLWRVQVVSRLWSGWMDSFLYRDERKQLLHINATRWQQTPHNNSPTIVFCFSFLTAHDKLFTFYSLPVTHFTFYQLLRYCQGDIIRTWCNLWCIQYELQTFF